MKVSSARTHLEIRRSFEITEGGPIVSMAYSSPPKKVRVLSGTITYTLDEGRWIARNKWSVKLNTVVLKKDGTDSKNFHQRTAESNGEFRHELVPADGWEWLGEIIELLRPTGDLSMTILRGHEVSP